MMRGTHVSSVSPPSAAHKRVGDRGPCTPRFSPESVAYRSRIPSQTLLCSRDVGWTSLLLDYHTDSASEEPFETGPTADQVITVMTEGTQEVECLNAGVWQRSMYRAGTVGLSPPGEVDRLRRRPRRGTPPARKVTLYIPQQVFDEAADHYCRAGQTPPVLRLDALAFDDALLAQTAVGLVHAVDARAPDLYAERCAQWLALHLLARHSPWRAMYEN